MAADPILDNLTAPQREAVTHRDGPMLVVAGAGSGKTRVVTRRVAYLIREGVHPGAILALTFTNKAAGEMRERITELVGEAPRWIGTFHSACARMLRFDLERLPDDPRDGRYSIYDDSDQQGLIKECIKRANIDEKRFTPRKVLGRISNAKSAMTPPDEFGEGGWDDEIIAKLYREYEKRLRAMNAVDFDDLLGLTARLLQACPEVAEHYRRRFRYLLVDEYQDTNRVQYLLMRALAGEAKNLHATGDPDQSIYSWRGADYQNIMDFQSDFPDARVVRLEQNYRSSAIILQVANQLIEHNHHRLEKRLFTDREGGAPLRVAHLPDDRAEAMYVADRLAEIRGGGSAYGETAIFYRTNAQSRAFEERLLSTGIPYQIVGGVRFYDRREVKDLLAHLKIMVNPRDAVSLRRVVACRPTGVGEKTLAAVLAQAEAEGLPPFALLADPDFAARFRGRCTAKLRSFATWCGRVAALPWKPVGDALREVLAASGLIECIENRDDNADERLANLETLVNRAYEFQEENPEGDLAAFLEDVALVADIDTWDEEVDRVSMMTLHSAKGLEFPYVFVVGLEEGLLPHANADTDAAREEERRLLYVGITRGEKEVVLTHAARRMVFGRVQMGMSSRFLRELPEEALEFDDMVDPFASWDDGMAGGGGGDDAADDPFGDGLFDDPFLDDAPSAGGNQTRSAPRGRSTNQHPVGRTERTGGGGRARTTRAGAGGRTYGAGRVAETAGPKAARPGAGDGPGGAHGGGGGSTSGFRAGDHVEHPVFGRGKILSVSKQQAVVQFFASGTKLLHLASAKLQRL